MYKYIKLNDVDDIDLPIKTQTAIRITFHDTAFVDVLGMNAIIMQQQPAENKHIFKRVLREYLLPIIASE